MSPEKVGLPEYDTSIASEEVKTSISPLTPKRGASYRSSVFDLGQTIALPVFNILLTCTLIGMLLLVYVKINGLPADQTLSGIPIPVCIAIIVSLLKLCVAGGIAIGISEYKWVRFQRGAALSLWDVYDACSRGLAAIVNVLSAYPMDSIVILATIFHLGLLVLGPAAQGVYTISSDVLCFSNDSDSASSIRYNDVVHDDLTTAQTDLRYAPSNDVRAVRGIGQSAGLRQALFESVFNYKTAATPIIGCSSDQLLNCTYGPIPIIHPTVDCKNSSLQAQVINVHNKSVTTLASYYKVSQLNDNITIPEMFYAPSMLGRTNYDLNNFTDLYNTSSTYDPTLTKWYGDQSFILVTPQDSIQPLSSVDNTTQVYECTFKAALNQTMITVTNTSILRNVLSTTPINFDYVQLSNNTYWNNADLLNQPDMTMRNAYGLLLQLMEFFVAEGSYQFSWFTQQWSDYHSNLLTTGEIENSPTDFFQSVLEYQGLAMGFVPQQYQTIYLGGQCYLSELRYHTSTAGFVPFALSFLVPTIWWVLLWISSMYRTNAISKGSSQIAQLVSGLTPQLRANFRGMSHANQYQLLKRAKNVHAHYGEVLTDSHRIGHAGFGIEDELQPIVARKAPSS